MKQTEQLWSGEGPYRLLIEAITDYAIYMLDRNGIVSSWNPGAERFKGYRAEEIIGKHFSTFYTEEDRQAGLPDLALRTAATEGRYEREGWRVRKDGARFWASVIIDAVRSPSGELIGFAKITRDLTERKLAEIELERTRAALLQSQKLEAIGQLTGGVAHDFNNLLTAALGSLELLRKRMAYDRRLSPLLDNALQAMQRGAALTERMLAFARRQDLQIGPVEVAPLVHNLHSFLQRSIGPAVRLAVRIPADLPRVRTDAVQFETALLNLVLNARDAMPDGGLVTITSRVAAISNNTLSLPSGEYVVVSVTDTGSGMDPETAARAIEPFFSTKGVGKGTGLGLSMVHGLAAQCGGSLDIQSSIGGGTTVEVWLPVTSEVVPEASRSQHHSSRRQFVTLLVDDDPLVLTNVAALMEDLGHFVVTAASGEDALQALDLQPDVDVVIADYAMPGMNGLQLAKRIRESGRQLPIILATGYADIIPPDEPTIRRLKKPFNQEQLQDALVEAADSSGSRSVQRLAVGRAH